MDPLHALTVYRQCLSKGGVLVLELQARQEKSVDQTATGEDGTGTRSLPVLLKILEGLGMAVESSHFFDDSRAPTQVGNGRALISARVTLR
jgi:hypothetical protein